MSTGRVVDEQEQLVAVRLGLLGDRGDVVRPGGRRAGRRHVAERPDGLHGFARGRAAGAGGCLGAGRACWPRSARFGMAFVANLGALLT
ncbi:MAG: hypothetical protein ACXV3F_14300, partial [Frankiaceae bacterium]